MEISKTVDGTAVMLSLSGWLDTGSAPQLQAAVAEIGAEVKDLVLDFEGVEYVSSSGLREVVLAERKMRRAGGTFTLIRVPLGVMDVFRMTGLDKRLNILS